MRLILMGPPGAGKGTQAKVVAEHFGIPRDLDRRHLPRATSPRAPSSGVEAKRYMDAGEYVPDEITNLMVRNRIDEADAEPGFLLDGYPRTLAQVEELDGMIEFTGHQLDAVVVLTVDQRGARRSGCCQRAETEGRADDTEDVIRRRQEVYAEQTAPLIEVYRDRGLLVEVDGMGEVDEVTARIFDALDERPASSAPRVRRRVPRPRRRDQDARPDRPDAGRRPAWSGETLELLRAVGAPGHHHRRARRDRRGATSAPRAACRPSWATATRRSRRTHLRLGQRRGRARHPGRPRRSHDGDVVSIDCGAIVDGWHGDAAITVAVGEVPRRRTSS